MKQIEVPYNYDTELIDFLYRRSPDGEKYHCIYSAPYWEDYKCAKYYYNHNGIDSSGNVSFGLNLNKVRNQSRQDYEYSINYAYQKFPKKLMLLLQQNNQLIDEKLLKEYYIDKLHFTKFCCGSIEQAKIIKKINPNLETVASISMKLEPEQLNDPLYQKYFDYVVLWFTYNKNIKKAEKLPKKFKYILLANCSCSTICSGTHHWFAASLLEDSNVKCPKALPNSNDYENTILVKPEDVYVWDDLIDVIKLQGREYHTETIIKDVVRYTTDKNNYPKNSKEYIETYNKFVQDDEKYKERKEQWNKMLKSQII